MKRQPPATGPEREFALRVTQTELTTIVAALEYWERRQLFLSNLARNHGREKESVVRLESSATTAALSERLQVIGAQKEGQ